MILFETPRLLVRKFTAADADDFFLINGDEEIMRFIRPAKNRADSDTFLAENIDLYAMDSVIGRFAVYEKTNGLFRGMFSLLPMPDNAGYHIGFALLRDAWRMGFATELVKTGTVFFFNNADHPQLLAITHPGNVASQQVLLKCGYSGQGVINRNEETLKLFSASRS